MRDVPGPELRAPEPVADSYEEQIARTDLNLLRLLRRGQVRRGHAVARLEPGTRAPRNIQQHAAPDDSVVRVVDGKRARALRGDSPGARPLYSFP